MTSGTRSSVSTTPLTRSVGRAYGRSRVDPDLIDLPDLLAALGEVAAERPDNVSDALVGRLVKLAALALLWSESVDDLGNLAPVDDPEIDALLVQMDERHGARPTLGERQVER
jgi:hypothetical protein